LLWHLPKRPMGLQGSIENTGLRGARETFEGGKKKGAILVGVLLDEIQKRKIMKKKPCGADLPSHLALHWGGNSPEEDEEKQKRRT